MFEVAVRAFVSIYLLMIRAGPNHHPTTHHELLGISGGSGFVFNRTKLKYNPLPINSSISPNLVKVNPSALIRIYLETYSEYILVKSSNQVRIYPSKLVII